jgi:hypothetical protein
LSTKCKELCMVIKIGDMQGCLFKIALKASIAVYEEKETLQESPIYEVPEGIV